MQAAVVPIIASAAVGLVKGCFSFPPCVLVALGCAAAYLLLDVNPIVLVLAGVVSGLIISGYYERKGGMGHGAA